jgi:hypothetical protein
MRCARMLRRERQPRRLSEAPIPWGVKALVQCAWGRTGEGGLWRTFNRNAVIVNYDERQSPYRFSSRLFGHFYRLLRNNKGPRAHHHRRPKRRTTLSGSPRVRHRTEDHRATQPKALRSGLRQFQSLTSSRNLRRRKRNSRLSATILPIRKLLSFRRWTTVTEWMANIARPAISCSTSAGSASKE